MKTIYALLLCLGVLLFGQTAYAGTTTYTISFSASGVSTEFDSVVVYNSIQDLRATVMPGQVLELNLLNSNNKNLYSQQNYTQVFPNPMLNHATLTFPAKNAGITEIAVYDLTGKKITETQMEVEESQPFFEINLPAGIYLIKVSGNEYSYTSKIISLATSNTTPAIHYNGMKQLPASIQKAPSNSVTMPYNSYEHLIFTGFNGDHSSIVADRPKSSKTINFEFVECKDNDGNHYPTVKIGNQIWMAENLKTTTFRNGDQIETTTEADLDNDETKIFQWAYKRDEENAQTYGRLYTWYAATDEREVLPEGWRLPAKEDWEFLEDFLFTNGHAFYPEEKVSKTVAKSMASTTNWRSYVAVGAPSKDQHTNNSSGFSAQPAGYYSPNNIFFQINDMTRFWADEFDAKRAWCTGLDISYRIILTNAQYKHYGYSIRGILIE